MPVEDETSRSRTCFPVNPWQMTRVFLSTHTLAVDDMDLRPAAALALAAFEARRELMEFIITSLEVYSMYACKVCAMSGTPGKREWERNAATTAGRLAALMSCRPARWGDLRFPQKRFFCPKN